LNISDLTTRQRQCGAGAGREGGFGRAYGKAEIDVIMLLQRLAGRCRPHQVRRWRRWDPNVDDGEAVIIGTVQAVRRLSDASWPFRRHIPLPFTSKAPWSRMRPAMPQPIRFAWRRMSPACSMNYEPWPRNTPRCTPIGHDWKRNWNGHGNRGGDGW
jgi:hypothetical protein